MLDLALFGHNLPLGKGSSKLETIFQQFDPTAKDRQTNLCQSISMNSRYKKNLLRNNLNYILVL
jgi:hypothetical protein